VDAGGPLALNALVLTQAVHADEVWRHAVRIDGYVRERDAVHSALVRVNGDPERGDVSRRRADGFEGDDGGSFGIERVVMGHVPLLSDLL
jgi:hypothetical protein